MSAREELLEHLGGDSAEHRALIEALLRENEPRRAWSSFDGRVEIRVSLEVKMPGVRPQFIEGMRLSVDRYMYDRYSELSELDKWLHHQVVGYVVDHSTVNRVAVVMPCA